MATLTRESVSKMGGASPRPATVGERPIRVIEAPTNLGLKPPRPGREPGTRRLPEALAAAGLFSRLGLRRGLRIEPPPYSPLVHPATGVRNAPAIARYSLEVARAVGEALDRGAFPFVLGGDCSVLLGNALALRRRGRYGLIFIDGHADFSTPETSESHGAAGMDLAIATGHGPGLLANPNGLRPLLREQDVVILGIRGEDPEAEGISAYSVEKLRKTGIAPAARREIARLRSHDLLGFWIHVDADVLDESLMPAVDSPSPGGLSFEELTAILREFLRSGAAVGMHVGIYDPDRDPDGRCAKGLVEALVNAF